jgi:GDP-L-fucose synthase
MKVIVIGGNGFVGRNVVEVLSKAGIEVHTFSRRTNSFDLLFLSTNEYHDRLIRSADYIINCAANVGSLNYVTDKAAEVIDTNTRMIVNLYYLLARLETPATVINPIANCAFPGWLSLYREVDLWAGHIHESVMSYGMTRRLLVVVAKCYEMQYGIKSINYYVPNMYGEYDSTDPNKAHALNALVSKVVKAKHEKQGEITIWGTGKPIREWLYAKDFGRVILETIKSKKHFEDNLNVGQKYGVSVNKLLDVITPVVKYQGMLVHDISKQDGAMEKVMDNENFKLRFPDFEFTPLYDGIINTVRYYESVYPY